MIDNRRSTVIALEAFHYISPIVTACCFVFAKCATACFLHEPGRDAGKPKRRYPAVTLLLIVATTFVAQGINYIVDTARSPAPSRVSQDQVVYTIIGGSTYASLALGLAENKRPLWQPYITTGLVGLILEIPCAVLQHLISARHTNALTTTDRVAGHARWVLLAIFCMFTGLHALLDKSRRIELNDETEALLQNGHKTNGTSNDATTLSDANTRGNLSATADDDSTNKHSSNKDSDDEDDSDCESFTDDRGDKETKAQQRKRLKEAGSWLNYLLDFKVFIPMLWPAKNRQVQLCLLIVIITLVIERFLNVLVPRQLGIVTNELTTNWGSGQVPWKAVGTWMFLTWLNSRAGIDLIRSLAQVPIQQFAYRSISVCSFSHIMQLSMDFHTSKNSGELIRAIGQGQNLQGLLEFFFFDVGPMFIDLIIAFVYVYTLFDIYMSMILVGVGIVYVWIGIKTTALTVNKRRRLNSSWRDESKTQNEAINNWQTVSHFNRGEYEADQYSQIVNKFTSAERAYFMSYYIGSAASTMVMLLGRLSVTGLAAYRISQGRAPIGHFVTLVSYWSSIESPLGLISFSVRRVSSMLTDSERLLQLMKTKPSVVDKPDAKALVITSGEVQFDAVNFAYDPRKPLIRDVSFTAKPGQTIALVGETGGGKSTILKLLYRYYDINGGAIRIDGQDIRDVTMESLRDSFGMVPQDPALFNISIMKNIKYARLDATDEEVREACRAAAIHDKILTFPDGYDSEVGERGVKLSGGELQRVAIARAILRQPRIVLLDEATSSVDTVTEEQIQKAFKELTSSRTTFVVAHRLSTIQHADQILVISDGCIVEHGTHKELFKRNGKYVQLWSKQISKDAQSAGTDLLE